jgi:predicted acylesterase/phospholipase RssA
MPLDYPTIQDWQAVEAAKGNVFKIGLWERILYNANIPRQEKWFFITYQCICLLSLILYLFTIGNLSFSLMMGSFATVLLAVGILIGFFSLVSFISVSLRVNFHVIGFLAVIIFGKTMEPHFVNLITLPENTVNKFSQRPGLHDYFSQWVQQRASAIKQGPYPVYFVLADGGASRSGYWTAATLSKIEDTTKGKFSQHLFCLSGASGGSVGNGTFFSLLMHKNELKAKRQTFSENADAFLKTDFLTFTLARMLGPDFMRPLIGNKLPMGDRAAALEKAIEEGAGDAVFLNNVFKTPMSELLPIDSGAHLPILCINVTRMQDGRPSVITNIRADEQIFSRRVDVLRRLPNDNDMRLSTAVVMGARFPYISPAGRIDSSYYVDGGYFDNSGAGFVHEMIIELQRIINDSLRANPAHYYRNLRFYVLHSQNGGNGDKLLQKIHPVWNDLGSPILTMMGAYGTQTSVNDLRLKNYMQDLYRGTNETGYFSINLYSNKKMEEEYPMNWAISNYYINKMNEKLQLPDNDFAFFYNYMKRRGFF